jgi:hypothetical protein
VPILAGSGIPVIDRSEPDLTADFVESRTFAFRTIDGSQVLKFTGDEMIMRWGITGLDVPDRELVEEEIPGQDGTDLVDVKVGSRPYFLPIFCGSDSGHLQFLRNRAYLRSLFNHRHVDYRRNAGTFDLVASSVLGERTLRSAFVSATSGEYAADSMGSYWQSFGINALAVNPYWRGERWTTPIVQRASTGAFFGTFPPQLSSSRALGADIEVTVGGEVESWPRIDLVGPATSVEINGPGLYLSIPGGLGAGEVAVVETNPRDRFDGTVFNGDPDWARIAPGTRFAPINPGTATFNVAVAGVSGTSSATISGDSLWETPW